MSGHVAIIGLGNIGAPVCDLLARLPEVGRLTLVDRDVYTEANLRGQTVSRAEMGRPKARAQARRLKRIRPDLQVVAYCDAVENLPLGALKCDVICACLDSRISRMTVNEAAWRLGVPWIDAGVLASEMLARVEVFLPAPDAPCLECAFGETHYTTLEVRHPCQKGAFSAPTNAPAYLGAQAASLQAAECHRLLCDPADGGARDPRAGLQVLHGLRGYPHFVSRNRRNPDCRFDHRVFAPREVSGRLRLKGLLFPKDCPPNGRTESAECITISAPGRRFVQGAVCPLCGHIGPAWQCVLPGSGARRECWFCGDAAPIHPELLRERLCARDLSPAILARSPRALGLRPGDLITVSDVEGDRHYLIGGPTAPWRRR